MGRKRIGGYVFEWYIGDHRPFHVHVYENGVLLGRFNIESQKPMKGFDMTRRLKKALMEGGFLKESKK